MGGLYLGLGLIAGVRSLELGVVMAIIGGMAKLSFILGLVEKEDYCPFVPEVAAK